ncbi:MAG: hypothetical protein RLZZ53_1137 [Acidobacteriota bacterium]|jgi:hypothetical protein
MARVALGSAAAWIVNGRPVPYWRGRIETIRYEFQP